MPIAVNMFIATVGSSWRSVGGQLLASSVLLLSGHQDLGIRTRIGATFGFFMALAFGTSALVTAIRAEIWGGVVICAVALCFEGWLIRRLWHRKTSP
jgi:hypothetical protein